jgi:hypothetical protein
MIGKMARPGRAAPRKGRRVDPNNPPFSAFLERDGVREKRQRGRRWTLVVSVGVHVVALLALLVYSLVDVDELFGPSVEVKIYAPGAAPSGANHQNDPHRPIR